MAFKQQEVAEIIVNGRRFRDWESVAVILVEGESNDSFRFTATEGKPLSSKYAELQLRPGDECTVIMAGELAITGYIETRKVKYTATQHGIELIGVSKTKQTVDAAAKTKTMEFRNKDIVKIATDVVKPAGIKVKEVGPKPINKKPFERASIPPGQSMFHFIESLARMRGASISSDKEGNMTLRAAWDQSGDSLVEGKNILEGEETMTISGGGGPDEGTGQDIGTDQHSMATAAHGSKAGSSNGIAKAIGSKGIHAPNTQRMEHPGSKTDAQLRSRTESGRRGQEQLEVNIVVQGWLKPSGGLWRAGKMAHVKSPMLIVDEDLKIMKVVLTQDNKSGTRTEIQLTRDTGEEADKGTGTDIRPGAQQPGSTGSSGATGTQAPGGGISGTIPP